MTVSAFGPRRACTLALFGATASAFGPSRPCQLGLFGAMAFGTPGRFLVPGGQDRAFATPVLADTSSRSAIGHCLLPNSDPILFVQYIPHAMSRRQVKKPARFGHCGGPGGASRTNHQLQRPFTLHSPRFTHDARHWAASSGLSQDSDGRKDSRSDSMVRGCSGPSLASRPWKASSSRASASSQWVPIQAAALNGTRPGSPRHWSRFLSLIIAGGLFGN